MEVDDEEGLRGLDVLAALIFLALGAPVAAGKLRAKSLGDVGNFPVEFRSRVEEGR